MTIEVIRTQSQVTDCTIQVLLPEWWEVIRECRFEDLPMQSVFTMPGGIDMNNFWLTEKNNLEPYRSSLIHKKIKEDFAAVYDADRIFQVTIEGDRVVVELGFDG